MTVIDELGRVRGDDLEELLAQLEDVERYGSDTLNAWKATCPAHGDVRPWLLFTRDEDGIGRFVRFRCLLPHSPEKIVATLRARLVTGDPDSRSCDECERPFKPRRADALYCGGACRVRAHRRRRAAA